MSMLSPHDLMQQAPQLDVYDSVTIRSGVDMLHFCQVVRIGKALKRARLSAAMSNADK